MFAGALAPKSQPSTYGVPPALPSHSAHLTPLPAQVPVEVSFGEGQKRDRKPGTKANEYLTSVFSPDTEEVVVTSGRREQVEKNALLSSCRNAV